MLKDRLIDALKNKKTPPGSDEKMSQVISKIQKEKKLSSKEFLEVYDSIRREGPTTKYLNPDGRYRDIQPSADTGFG